MTRSGVLWPVLLTVVMACASVLGVRPIRQRAFEHRAHALKGVACPTCHTRVANSTASAPLDLPDARTCIGCHKKPHDASSCGRCHGRPHHRARLQADKDHLRFSHAEHERVALGACVRCHRGIAEGDERLRPTMATCFSCHVHSDQWGSHNCAACHRNLEGEQTRPRSHVVHGQDFITRHGVAAASARDLCSTCHSDSSCAQCHGIEVPVLPNVVRFDRVTNAQLHRAGFLARHALEARADPGLCMTCHSEASCQACHADRGLAARADPRYAPHPAGWVGPPGAGNTHGSQARRDPMACASCHGGAGERLCVGCHRVGGLGGNPHPAGFSSHKRRSELPCRQCHGGLP